MSNTMGGVPAPYSNAYNSRSVGAPIPVPAAPAREQNMDNMSSGVRNMSITDSNGHRVDPRAMDRRVVDLSGQLIRSNSFH